jgi:hypothetical protein
VDRHDFTTGEIVTESHLETFQTNVEDADGDLAQDAFGGSGLVSGCGLTEQGTPSWVLSLAAGVLRDALGRRMVVTGTTVDTATATSGGAISVGSGNERYVDVYARFVRGADVVTSAGTDAQGNALTQTVNPESYELLVVAGTEAGSGLAVTPTVPSGSPVLLGRYLRTAAMTAVRTRDLRKDALAYARSTASLWAGASDRRLVVVPTDPPSMAVRVRSNEASPGSAVRVLIDRASVSVASQTTSSITAPGSNSRYDLIAINSLGSVTVVAGTAGASPTRPAVPAAYLPLAYVLVSAAQTAIEASHIEDARPFLASESTQRSVHRETASGGQQEFILPFTYTLGAHALLVTVNGVLLDATQYVETTGTVTLVTPCTGGDVVVIRRDQVQPINAVALAQMVEDLSGIQKGLDVLVEDRGAGIRVYVQPGRAIVGRVQYTVASEQTINPGALSANTTYYLYAYPSAGALAFELSTTQPENTRTWKNGDTTRLFLSTLRADSGSALIQGQNQGGFWWYFRTAEMSSDTAAFTGQSQTTWTDASLASYVPPHCRRARVELTLGTQNTVGYGEIRTKGTTTSSLKIQGPTNGVTSIYTYREVEIHLDTSQRIQYQVSDVTLALSCSVVGFQDR